MQVPARAMEVYFLDHAQAEQIVWDVFQEEIHALGSVNVILDRVVDAIHQVLIILLLAQVERRLFLVTIPAVFMQATERPLQLFVQEVVVLHMAILV